MSAAPSSVLLVLDRAGRGGMQGVVSTLAIALSDRGIDVHVAAGGTLPMPPDLEAALVDDPPGLSLHRLADPGGPAGRARWLGELSRVISTVRPDILHGHGLRTSLPLVMTGRRRPRRIVVTCHGLPPGDLVRTARLVKPTKVTVAAVGPGLADDLRAHGLRTVLLPNGVTQAPRPLDRATFMTSVGLDPSRPLVVAPARLSPQKDPLTLLGAIEHTSAALAFVGDGPLRGALDVAISARGLTDRVIVTGWRDDARSILGAADVLASSSTWEGQALVMIEAAMAGVPIVATSAPGVVGWLADGSDALLVPVGDERSLGAAIKRALDDESIRATLVAGSRALGARHSVTSMVEHHLSVYATVM